METEFTPASALIGGGLIGLASVILMVTHGRILGVTGILAGAIRPDGRADWNWRIAILAGMLTAPLLYVLVVGKHVAIQVPVTSSMLVIGGILVGIGATLGSGCTSGHGVCGMARLSRRSIVATIIFMLMTAVTVFIVRHATGT